MALDSFRHSKVAEIERELAEARELDCSIKDCPLRWSVETGGNRFCSGHAWSHKTLWETVTQENHQHLLREKPKVNPPTYLLTRSQQREYLLKMQQIAKESRPNKDWAVRLQRLHESGKTLSKFQVDAYKTALKLHLEVTK